MRDFNLDNIIYHHLGIGDHIICNGLVRNFYKKNNSIDLFCYDYNEANVKYMYRDLKNLNTIPVSSDQEANLIILKNNLNVLKVGFENLHKNGSFQSFDIEFYEIANLPFSCKFDDFYLERDFEKELSILDSLNPNKDPYIFIHGDLDMSKIRKDLKIINNPKEYGLFNLISLLENAEEIHVMESSIKCLINQYKLNKPKLYHHNYVKYCSEYYNTVGLNTYQIIN
jgi:hypothetical protein